jgi:hypothetical protein
MPRVVNIRVENASKKVVKPGYVVWYLLPGLIALAHTLTWINW